ncbi:MAG: hypothetical protein IJW21_07075 [Clostridia bacterium]|nr:hypothetical protein [Clostridia bacterium]
MAEVTKADKSCKDFCFFATFFSKKKVDKLQQKPRAFAEETLLFCKRVATKNTPQGVFFEGVILRFFV